MSLVLLGGGKGRRERYNGMVAKIFSGPDEKNQVKMRIVDTGQLVAWSNWTEENQAWIDINELENEDDNDGEFFQDYNFRLLVAKFFEKPLGERPKVGYMRGGSYNSIVVLIKKDGSRLLLRLPREVTPKTRFETTTRLLQLLLATRKQIPVPRLLSAEYSSSLGRPFMMFKQLPGRDLERGQLHEMPVEDACHLAHEVARILASMYTVQFAGCGTLVVDEGKNLAVGRPVPLCGGWKEPGFSHEYDKKHAPPQTLLEFLETRFSMISEAAKTKLRDCVQDATILDVFRACFTPFLISVAKILDVSDEPCRSCLYHPDARSHNFLVAASPQGHPMISGFLDWDDCEALLPELAYRVPSWLWSLSDTPEYETRWGCVGPSFYVGEDPDAPCVEPSRSLVRQAFVTEIEQEIPGFMSIATQSYSSGLVVLGQVARSGIYTSDECGLVRDLLRRFKSPGCELNMHDEAQNILTTMVKDMKLRQESLSSGGN